MSPAAPESSVSAHADLPRTNSYSISIHVQGTALEKYPAKQHARRVAAQLNGAGGLIYLMGQRARPLEDSDQEVPFRQRRYFFYLSGVEEADCHLLYDVGADCLILYVPDFELERAIWMGPTLGREEASDKYDVDKVKYYSALKDDVSLWVDIYAPYLSVYVLHKDQVPPFNQKNLRVDISSLKPAMDACRVIKDSHEIGLIKRANKVSAAAHISVLRGIKTMVNEAEIHGTFLDTCVSRGARNQAYAIIAASGENAATLHYTKNNEPLKGRQFVCLDAGAEWSCYASDVTRTFPISDGCWPSEQARNIYAAVQRMQDECISHVKEGTRFLYLHWLAHDIAIEELLRLGIFKGGSVAEIRKSRASMLFFPHGLGHHLGLEVHDVAPESTTAVGENGISNQAPAAVTPYRAPCTVTAPPLKAGMVVTVEPGIYFSRLALAYASESASQYIDMDVVEQYFPVGGVRIEDDILVTEDGFVNLTTAPKGKAMLDIIQNGNL